MLGIGGVHALAAVGLTPTVCHMNEGHSAFLALERIRRVMSDKGVTFAVARSACPTKSSSRSVVRMTRPPREKKRASRCPSSRSAPPIATTA